MKRIKKMIASAMVAATLFSLSVGNVYATESKTIILDKAYTYKIAFHAGEHGTFANDKINAELADEINAGAAVRTIEGVNAQTTAEADSDSAYVENLSGADAVGVSASGMTTVLPVSVETINGVQVAGKEYYVRGFKVSGHDNVNTQANIFANITIAPEDFAQSGDMEYVISYGIKGEQINYTVHYVDTDGNALLPSEVFSANIGDKPIVMYRYIPDYAPQVKAFTQTLNLNPDGTDPNYEFTFVYDLVPTQTFVENITEETYYNTVTQNLGTIVQEASNVTGGGTGGAGGTEAEAVQETAEETTGGEETGVPGLDSLEIVDLDDEETPLGEMNLNETEDGLNGFAKALGFSLAGLLLIAALAAYIAFRKKET